MCDKVGLSPSAPDEPYICILGKGYGRGMSHSRDLRVSGLHKMIDLCKEL